jgi:two-component system nitrate/nitrite response regulator NarL
MVNNAIRIVVADDHPLFRGGVVRTLAEFDDMEVLAECGSAEAVIEAVGRLLPDIVLLDISMPGGGLEAARQIGQRFPAVHIVMLTVSEADDDVLAALQAGARGYVLKGVGAAQLIDLVRGVAGGASYVSPDLAARVLSAMQHPARARDKEPDPIADLSKREEQILRLVAQGRSNKEVGRELDLQEKTVKHYMTNILQKLQVRNRVEAALLARERGI